MGSAEVTIKLANGQHAMKKSQPGFTLIELMIVVAIVGILASIAYPSYRQQVLEGRRSEGRAALLALAQAQERFFTLNGTYTNIIGSLNGVSTPTENGHYTLATTGGATFTATATPAGAQAGDTDCTTMTITHQGAKSGTGADISTCW